MNKRQAKLILTWVAVVLLVLGASMTTLAASFTMTYLEGNKQTFGSCTAFKPLEDARAGTFTMSDGTLDVRFTISGDLTFLNWSSNIPVSHVFVKGGTGGNHYNYSPAATEGKQLVAPANDKGINRQISHVTFYYCPQPPDPEKVTLTVNKEIIHVNGNSLSNNSAHNDVKFNVTVNNTPYTISASKPLELTGQEPGSFKVEEITSLPEGYTYVSGNKTVNIVQGSGTVTITNRYTPPADNQGTLMINKKIIDGEGNSLSDCAEHRQVKFDVIVNGTRHTVSASTPLVLTGLAPGKYMVEEITPLPQNYSYVSGNGNVTIESGGTKTVNITNKYTPPTEPGTVTLVIEKNLIDNRGNSLNNSTVHNKVDFTVYINGKAYTVSASSPLVLSGLTPGTYTVTESTKMPAKYMYVSGNQTVQLEEGTTTVTLCNIYEPELPKTGGTDVGILLLGLLMAGSGLLLFFRKRKTAK